MATVLGKNEPIFKVWLSFRRAGKSQSSPLGKLMLIKATDSLSRIPPSVSVFKCKAEKKSWTGEFVSQSGLNGHQSSCWA